jgi:signal peptidase II
MTELDENKILQAGIKPADHVQDAEAVEAESKATSNRERWILLVVAAIIILLDQGSKSVVESTLALYTYYAPIPALENIFRISHVTNTGVAFGLFPDGNLLFTLVALIVSVVIIIYNFRLAPGHRLLRLALGLQLGGAIGNLIDRLQQGYVTDFMDFGPWPVWNIADLAVVSGTVLLVWIMYQEEREEKKRAESLLEPNNQLDIQSESRTQQVDESSES